MAAFWKWLLVEDHRKALGFLGAGMAALVAAAWTLFVYLDADRIVNQAAPRGDAAQASPTPENAIAQQEDKRLTAMLVGSWDGGRRRYPSDVVLDVSYTFSPDGTYNWKGEGTFYTVLVSGDWRVRDGHTTVEVQSSNMPGMVAPGSKYTSRIEGLTDTRYTYIDRVTGERVTDRRIH